MLWSLSSRWSIYRPRLETHRFLVHPLHVSSFSPFSSTRRRSSASATAFLRPDASLSATRRPRTNHKLEQTLPPLEQRDKVNEYIANNEKISNGPFPEFSLPDGLMSWLDEHFAAGLPSQEVVRQKLNQRQDWMRLLNNGESVYQVADELAQTHLPQRTIYVLHAAHSLGLACKQNVYERITYRFANLEEWKLVLSVVAAGENATGKTTVRLLNWRGRALVNVQNYAELDGLLEEFANHGLKPQRRTYMLILQGHLRNHDLDRAQATIRNMETVGFPVTASTYSTIIPAYRGFGLDDFIRDQGYNVLRSKPTHGGEKILNGLLRLYLDRHDIDGALRLLENFGSLSRVSDTPNNFSPRGDAGDAAVFRHLTLEDRATYTILINYLSKYGPSSLTRILKRMRSCGSAPDIKVGTALVQMYYLRGEEHQALVVLRDCCKHRDLCIDALQLLGYDPQCADPSELAPFVGRPTTDLFNAVLHGAIRTRSLHVTLQVLKLMKDARIKPNSRTLETFLWHLSKERAILTEDLVDVLRSLLSSRIEPNLRVLNIILWSIVHTAKRSKYQEGWNALAAFVRRTTELLKLDEEDRAPSSNESRQLPTFDPVLCVTDLQTKMFSEVLEPIVQSLRRRRVMADRATFSLRMRYDTLTLQPNKAPDTVAENLQIMRERGLYPTVYHYAALMEAHCAAGNIRAAHEVLQNAIAGGSAPRQKSMVVLYTILISANSRIGRPDLALSMFREMLNANVAPDVASIDALVGAFFAVKAFRLARRVLLDLWPMVAPFPMEIRDAPLIDLVRHLRSIRDKAEAPRSGAKKPVSPTRNELRQLNNEIVAKWNDVLQAQHEDGSWDSPVEKGGTSHSDGLEEAEARQMDNTDHP